MLSQVPGAERITADEIAAAAFPKRLGHPEKCATLALELLTNSYLTASSCRWTPAPHRDGDTGAAHPQVIARETGLDPQVQHQPE